MGNGVGVEILSSNHIGLQVAASLWQCYLTSRCLAEHSQKSYTGVGRIMVITDCRTINMIALGIYKTH